MIEAVGMALLSSAVKLVFQKLASPDVVDLIRGKKLTKELLQKFKTAVLSVNAVLEDAEEKQITNSFVRDWIDELKDALYDADDILDGIATEAMRSKLEADLPTTMGKVQKSVIEAVTSSPCNTEDPTQVEEQLKKNLLGKKFLIVLDDVWSEDRVHQEFLSKLLQYGVQGSKVVITTRNDSVANAMRASATHRVKKLSDDDCWLLFAKQAFGDVCSDSHKELEAIGRQIIKKCKGLPLAVKAIGALLWSKLDADEWNKILQSDLWDLPINETNIQPALRLSYIYLPSHLKQCFAYCSLFLKDSSLEKDRIVLLWMAEGFLQPSKFETMEEVGHRYFLDLVARSLLQQSSDNKALFGMHDLIHDLAKSVAGQFSVTLEQGDTTNKIVKMTRHFSCSGASLDTFGKFEEALSKVFHSRVGKLKNLQGTLSISKLQNVVPPKDALNAGLKDKKDLEKLALEWDATTPRSERIVLESLRPHTSLKSLTIQGYGGGIFPDWVGHQSFSCITSIHLDQCRNVCSLPPFGQLCSLKELSIVGLDRVVTVDREFCGNSSTGSSSIQPFGGLKVLRFEKMWGWEEWLSSSSAENEGGGFPDLKELYIKDCPKLTGGLPIHIPSLAKLEIKSCPKLVASLLRVN
ncbi:putative disease resistance RPP13-like protein 1 [Morella rubra]|uniref:Putative disease resistance RPP13-like protein 1 n=1 Tax=Morella rubra TaxID=262757 RepID=A0A6A1UKD5_9ROSI|nr:putative disease resistance RPP13-like protein 1 [Morella rubra]